MQGTFEGVINIGQKLLLEIWRENSASPMHALHLGFGVGSLIVPQIAEPFLAITSPPSTFNVTESANSFTGITAVGNIFHVNSSTFALSHTESFVMSNDNQTVSNYLHVTEANVVFNSSPTSLTHSIPVLIERSTRIKWAFLIVALIAILISFMFFYFQFFGTSFRNSDEQENSLSGEKKEPEHSILQKIDPKTCTSTGSRAYGIQILTLLFLFCFQVFGGEYIIGKFIRSYAIDTYNMEGDEASWLNTCFWISYTVGCFIGFIAGKFVSIRLLLLIECVGLLASTLLFAIFAGQSETLLWIFTQLLGAFDAPAFPICIVWGDNHMKITGFGLTVISFGGSMGCQLGAGLGGNMASGMAMAAGMGSDFYNLGAMGAKLFSGAGMPPAMAYKMFGIAHLLI
ncbi:hypothetical protein FSP39_022612 [Pinctada imbricata]|uniref:Uncharacterized protein n=1 Tax=Pinctada imbricata TaxID=66713 RepID=A0AA88YME2_PINIB|nr:hypothetical protein FSP39_022612 [Pinctada imbricata]